MFHETVAAKALDTGAETKNGVASEHWMFKGRFPFPQQNDWWFASDGGALVQSNSYASVFKQGTVIGNTSFTNWGTNSINASVFDVPTSDPTFGVCKPCSDPACDCGDDLTLF